MTVSEKNEAAWLVDGTDQYQLLESPCQPPGPGEVLIKNRAIGINPGDWKIKYHNLFELPRPLIPGFEVAGDVAAVGEGVHNVQVGQRVVGYTIGSYSKRPRDGAFQRYSMSPAKLCCPIPSSLTYSDAVVLPVSITTATAALYNPGHFALPLPTVARPSTTGTNTLIVWGASSCVGLGTLQLAKISGIQTIAIAGKQNHQLCKSLGAAETIDHRDPDVITRICQACTGKNVIGVFGAIATTETIKQNIEILDRLSRSAEATVTKLVVVAVPLIEKIDTKGIEVRPVFGVSTLETGVAEPIWWEFMPEALAAGSVVPKPEKFVAGKGIVSLQHAVEVCRKGYSARKVVVEL